MDIDVLGSVGGGRGRAPAAVSSDSTSRLDSQDQRAHSRAVGPACLWGAGAGAGQRGESLYSVAESEEAAAAAAATATHAWPVPVAVVTSDSRMV